MPAVAVSVFQRKACRGGRRRGLTAMLGLTALTVPMLAGSPVRAQDANYAAPQNINYLPQEQTYTSLSVISGEPRPSIAARDVPPGGLSVAAVGTETGYFDTNPLLLTSGAKSLFGSITTPELVVNDVTPTTTIYSDTLVNANVFNQSNFNSNDVHSVLNLTNQTERWGTGLLGQLDYDTTRSSELSNYNFQVNPVRHFGGEVAPQVSYNILPTDKILVQGAYQTSQYDGHTFIDYNTISATPTYTHAFDEMNSGVVTLQAQRYTATSGPSDQVDTIGPTIGWIGILTPQIRANANVGVQVTQQTGAQIMDSGWQTNYIFSGGLAFKGEQDDATVNATRSQYPFGNGTEALLTTLTAADTHAINRLFSVGGGLSYQSADYESAAIGNLKSLFAGTGNIAYHATDQIDVTAQYQYRRETLDGTGSDATENMATLSLTYHPKAWTL